MYVGVYVCKHIPRQLFHIENIPINNLPLQVGPSVVEMCSKKEFFMHRIIPTFLCHYGRKNPNIHYLGQSSRHETL
jgi:hypothetical protein